MASFKYNLDEFKKYYQENFERGFIHKPESIRKSLKNDQNFIETFNNWERVNKGMKRLDSDFFSELDLNALVDDMTDKLISNEKPAGQPKNVDISEFFKVEDDDENSDRLKNHFVLLLLVMIFLILSLSVK